LPAVRGGRHAPETVEGFPVEANFCSESFMTRQQMRAYPFFFHSWTGAIEKPTGNIGVGKHGSAYIWGGRASIKELLRNGPYSLRQAQCEDGYLAVAVERGITFKKSDIEGLLNQRMGSTREATLQAMERTGYQSIGNGNYNLATEVKEDKKTREVYKEKKKEEKAHREDLFKLCSKTFTHIQVRVYVPSNGGALATSRSDYDMSTLLSNIAFHTLADMLDSNKLLD
jgi:hypothetical protein